jgi:UDP:flavonoid glycosyltransferase YjiC (YdhE family)
MKKIVISTFGSFGDVHPYVAIALELKRRGHRPVIATSEIYREKTDALGLELYPVPPDLPSYDRPDEVARMVRDSWTRRRGRSASSPSSSTRTCPRCTRRLRMRRATQTCS